MIRVTLGTRGGESGRAAKQPAAGLNDRRNDGFDAFHFLFGYDPVYWKGLRKHNLINEHAGVRLLQCLYTPRMRCFNQWAAPGGCLYDEVWHQRRPLLIDRGCGGVAYENYPFDQRLMDRYARRLGDRFLGVQFHEWVCNVANDWHRIRQFVPLGRKVTLQACQEYFDYRSVDRALETGDPSDFAGRAFPSDPKAFAAECRRYQARKLADFHGYLCTVPSTGMAYAQTIRWGARVVMPEHGHHIPMARVHTAAARGAIRQHGRGQFGSYYAPWGNRPDSVTCHTPFNLWYLPSDLLCGDAFKHRGNGGSSRAFQRRLFWWAYLTGARYLAEEWGPENTFFDWNDFDLTPYGHVVRDFMQFVTKVGRGGLLTPAAVIIDRDWFGLDAYFLAGGRAKYLRFYEPTDHQQKVAAFFRALTGHQPAPPNDDSAVLSASPMPDAFDVVVDDAAPEVLDRYKVLLYVGEHPRRLRRYQGRLMMLDDPVRTAKAVTAATLEHLPLRIDGPVNWLVTRKAGVYQVGLFNPHGVTVDFVRGEQSDPQATVAATITGRSSVKQVRVRYAWPDQSRVVRISRHAVKVAVGPGGLVIVETDADPQDADIG
jgi:hypothetical protein